MTLPFSGFVPPSENYSKIPNDFIAMIADDMKERELKVTLYILRHTWGFQEFKESKRLTLDEFLHGRKYRDGTRYDYGCGLKTKASVIGGLDDAVQRGTVIIEKDDSDKARKERYYRLNMKGDVQNLDILDVQNLNIDGSKFEHRTEKETTRKKPGKETLAAAGAAKRDYLFDLVAILVFDFKTMALFDALDEKRKKQTGARIGKITAFLRVLYRWDAPIRAEQPPALIQQIKEDVAEFKQWYAIKENKARIPLDDGKFSTHYLAWYGDNRHRPPLDSAAGTDGPPTSTLKPRLSAKPAVAGLIEQANHEHAKTERQSRSPSSAASPEYRPPLPDGVHDMLAEAREKLRHKGA